MATEDAPVRSPRSNPFAFPSDVDYAFGLLIAVVVGTSMFVYLAIANTLAAGQATSGSDGMLCSAEFGAWAYAPRACHAGPPQLGGLALGLTFLLVATTAIYLLLPTVKTWRDRLVPLTAAASQALFDELQALCRTAGVARPPRFVWNPLNMASSGVAFGLPGRRRVALSGGLTTRFWTDPEVFRAVVLHELAHLRNQDVDKTYLTVAVWWAFLVATLVPMVMMVSWRDPGVWQLALSVGTLTVVVYLLRRAVLRTRETYADVRASTWPGYAAALDRTLVTTSSRPGGGSRILSVLRGWRSWHPSRSYRLAALADPSPLLKVGVGLTAGAGLAGTLALVDVQAVVEAVIPGWGQWAGVLVFSALIAGVVAVALWRATFLAYVGNERVAGLRAVAAGLAGGLAAGDLLSLSGYAGAPIVWQLSGAGLLLFDIFWYGLLLVGAGLFVRWLVGCASAWLPVAATRGSHRIVYLVGFLPAILVLGVGLHYLFNIARYRQFGALMTSGAMGRPGWLPVDIGPFLPPVVAVDGLLTNISRQPFYLAALYALWAVPLAAWFFRARTAPVVTARWAYLDPGPPQHGEMPPPMQVGLAVRAGLVGGLLFWAVTVPVAVVTLFRSPDAFLSWMFTGQAVFGIVLQAGVAVVLTATVARLAPAHGMLAAVVCGAVVVVEAFGLTFGTTLAMGAVGEVGPRAFLRTWSTMVDRQLTIGVLVAGLASACTFAIVPRLTGGRLVTAQTLRTRVSAPLRKGAAGAAILNGVFMVALSVVFTIQAFTVAPPAPTQRASTSPTYALANQVFADDFSTDTGWSRQPGDGYAISLEQGHPGALRIAVTKGARVWPYPAPPYQQMRVVAAVTKWGGSGQVGLDCKHQGGSPADGYSFRVDSGGSVIISAVGSVQRRLAVTSGPAWSTGQSRTLTVVCSSSGSTTDLVFDIDGKRVLSSHSADYAGPFLPSIVVQGPTAIDLRSVAVFTTPAAAAGVTVDRCLVGTWRVTVMYLNGTSGVSLAGGAGILLTIRADGTELYDYAASGPLQGEYQGHRLVELMRGYGTARTKAVGGKIEESPTDSSHLGVALSVDGGSPVSLPPDFTSYSTYTCSSTLLKLDNDQYERA
jgi:Zn-dependent protease with chaperone function